MGVSVDTGGEVGWKKNDSASVDLQRTRSINRSISRSTYTSREKSIHMHDMTRRTGKLGQRLLVGLDDGVDVQVVVLPAVRYTRNVHTGGSVQSMYTLTPPMQQTSHEKGQGQQDGTVGQLTAAPASSSAQGPGTTSTFASPQRGCSLLLLPAPCCSLPVAAGGRRCSICCCSRGGGCR